VREALRTLSSPSRQMPRRARGPKSRTPYPHKGFVGHVARLLRQRRGSGRPSGSATGPHASRARAATSSRAPRQGRSLRGSASDPLAWGPGWLLRHRGGQSDRRCGRQAPARLAAKARDGPRRAPRAHRVAWSKVRPGREGRRRHRGDVRPVQGKTEGPRW